MGELEARDSARPNPATQPDNIDLHIDWDVLQGKKHFVPPPEPPPQKSEPQKQPDYLYDICKDGGLALYRDPYRLSCQAYNNFKRFDQDNDNKLSLPEIKLIENCPWGDTDDRKLAFALDKGFSTFQAMSGGKDAITQEGLTKFNHMEDDLYMYALEHHGGSGKGLLAYLGTAIATGTVCWRLGLSFWPGAVATAALAYGAFALVERKHNRQQDEELRDLRTWQPKVDELIKSVQPQTPQKQNH